MRRHWLLLSFLALAACSTGVDTTVNVDDYKTSCTADSDCAAVFVGDPCTSACRCPNAAIDTTETLREQSDVAAAQALCTSSPPTCTKLCTNPTATCSNGVCALK